MEEYKLNTSALYKLCNDLVESLYEELKEAKKEKVLTEKKSIITLLLELSKIFTLLGKLDVTKTSNKPKDVSESDKKILQHFLNTHRDKNII